MPPLHILRVGSCWHYDCFACFALVFYTAYGEFADSFEDSYHGITCGIVCADLSNVPSYFYE